MKGKLLLGFCTVLSLSTTVMADSKIVTIESPVEVIGTNGNGDPVYWIQDKKQVKYRVELPETERVRLGSVIERSPTSVVRFDGTLTDNERQPVLKVGKWDTVRTTTSVSQDGSVKRETTVIDHQ